MKLGPIGIRAFTNRKINPATAARYGIYTASLQSGRVAPNDAGNIIVFPFIEDDRCVNEKYRGPDKKFWQRKGGKKTFWNAEALDLAEDGELIITEGELDALTAIDCGFDKTVSVPEGAPGQITDEPVDDEKGKFKFLWNNRDKLARIKWFVLAVDSDEPGQALAAELVRRFGAARCKHVTYPEDCKDLNEVMMQHGQKEVVRVLREAKEYPLTGLYRLSEYPEKPQLELCGLPWNDGALQHLRPFPGALMVVTGVPGCGKSSWVMQVVSHIVETKGWTAAVFSPEMPVVPHLRHKLRSIRARDGAHKVDADKLREIDEWIERGFVFLDVDPVAWDAEERTLEWVLDKAKDAVVRDSIKILVIDPWNEIEHFKRRDEMMTDYIGRGIRELRRFAQQRGVLVIIVAHPTKRDEAARRTTPTLYDVEGSAHWANKPDLGVVVSRYTEDKAEDDDGKAKRRSASTRGELTLIEVVKVRFGETGQVGEASLRYSTLSHRYHRTNYEDPAPLPDGAEEIR